MGADALLQTCSLALDTPGHVRVRKFSYVASDAMLAATYGFAAADTTMLPIERRAQVHAGLAVGFAALTVQDMIRMSAGLSHPGRVAPREVVGLALNAFWTAKHQSLWLDARPRAKQGHTPVAAAF